MNEMFLPDYGMALLVDAADGDLVDLVRDEGIETSTTVDKDFRIAGNGSCILNVRTTFEGSAANHARALSESMTPDQLTRHHKSDQARVYPNLVVQQPVSVVDDVDSNRVTTSASYRIDSFWNRVDADGAWAIFSPNEVTDEFVIPENHPRRTPLGLNHPCHVTVHTKVQLPGRYAIKNETKQVKTSSVAITHGVRLVGQTLSIDTEYRTLRDNVPQSEVAGYRTQVQNLSNGTSFQIARPTVSGYVPSSSRWRCRSASASLVPTSQLSCVGSDLGSSE